MVKAILFLSIIFTLSFTCNAQTSVTPVEKKTQDRIWELKKQGVTFSVSYHVNCIGYFHPFKPDSCKAVDIRYVFWKSKGSNFVQRFDNCYNYKPIEIMESLIDLVADNITEVKKAEIKYPQYVKIGDSKNDTISVMVDHSCHYIFNISTGKEKFIKDIDDFALDTKELDDYSDDIKDGPKKRHNENYEKNQLSILAKLKNMAEQITDAIKQKKAP